MPKSVVELENSLDEFMYENDLETPSVNDMKSGAFKKRDDATERFSVTEDYVRDEEDWTGECDRFFVETWDWKPYRYNGNTFFEDGSDNVWVLTKDESTGRRAAVPVFREV